MRDRTFNSLAVIVLVAMLPLSVASGGSGRGGRATVNDLQVGQGVAIEGAFKNARTVQASEIEIQEASDEQKLKGRIQNIDKEANSLIVLGTKVVAAQDARIADRAGSAIPFSSLEKGWMVKVKGTLQGEGALHASEIKVSREEAPDEAEVEGRVQNVDKARSTLTVAGLTIRLTPATKIKFD